MHRIRLGINVLIISLLSLIFAGCTVGKTTHAESVEFPCATAVDPSCGCNILGKNGKCEGSNEKDSAVVVCWHGDGSGTMCTAIPRDQGKYKCERTIVYEN